MPGLLPNIAGTGWVSASDQCLHQKWNLIFKAVCRNVRTWESFWSPPWKSASSKLKGRVVADRRAMVAPHGGEKGFHSCCKAAGQAAEPWCAQGRPRGGPSRSLSCRRVTGHSVLAQTALTAWQLQGLGNGSSRSGTNPSRRAWLLCMALASSRHRSFLTPRRVWRLLNSMLYVQNMCLKLQGNPKF